MLPHVLPLIHSRSSEIVKHERSVEMYRASVITLQSYASPAASNQRFFNAWEWLGVTQNVPWKPVWKFKPRRWTFRLLEAQLFSFYKALICSWSFLRVFCSSHGFPWSAHTSPELRCLDIVIIETTICRRWAVSQGWVHLHVSQRGCNRRALDVNQTYCGFQVRLPSQIRLSVLNFFAMPYLCNLTSDRVSYMPPLQVYHHSWWWALCVPWWKEWRSTIPSLVLQVWVGTVYLVKRVANLDSTNHCAFGVLSAR